MERLTMWTWPALLLAPTLALTDLTIVYALAMPECETQRIVVVHAVTLAFLLVTLLLTWLAWREWRHADGLQPHPPRPADSDAAAQRHPFIARVAVGSGALSSLVIAAMWIAPWLLSPCVA
jgi:hypothetical protein